MMLTTPTHHKISNKPIYCLVSLKMLPSTSILIVWVICLVSIQDFASAFVSPWRVAKIEHCRSSSLRVDRREDLPSKTNRTNKKTGSNKRITIAEFRKELLKNPAALNEGKTSNGANKKKKRTRRRTDNPQQTYVFAAQRKASPNQAKAQQEGDDVNNNGSEINLSSLETSSQILAEAKRMGLSNPAGQHCDPLIDGREPEIVGKIRVGEEETGSGAFAYLINKPQGWSILGGGGGGGSSSNTGPSTPAETGTPSKSQGKKSRNIKRVKIKDSKGKEEILEFDEADVWNLLSPEERAEIEAGGGSIFDASGPIIYDEKQDDFRQLIPGWNEVKSMSQEEREEAGIEDEDYDATDIPDFDEADLVALLSPEELMEYNDEKEKAQPREKNSGANSITDRYESLSEEDLDPQTIQNIKRIMARKERNAAVASFSMASRPSVVSWLKEKKFEEGTPIRGGNFWTAVAGAADVDDTGLVLLAPKENCNNLFVDFTEHIAVVGNGNSVSSKHAIRDSGMDIPTEAIKIDLISKLKRNRDGDIANTVRILVTEHFSKCASIIPHVQSQFGDGIRGDPTSHPFDRRAPRRLIHCRRIAVSSLIFDDAVQFEIEPPDDITILSDRLNNHNFRKGSFLGRQALQENHLTNAYREINGAADGYPGWTVDRYAEWLLVQHDEREDRGPLPSIHDGFTAGVYILPSSPNRGAMGSKDNVRPYLLEGRAAPETLEIMENGVKYQVSLDRDLSTGIFLDQRPHRAWLSQNCNSNTHILNCFAHCGAYSIAAATAGASTVSLDLNKKFLDRVQPQLEANGIEFDERHDCIYGDCFEWLEKLAKRGERFDVVILDPPSSSVGKKKRRWSVKNDMDELVQLAAPLVKSGGLLWTTTNSASISLQKFANLCQKGIEGADVKSYKLERLQPMAVDFPSVGPQPVKNLVWRIQR